MTTKLAADLKPGDIVDLTAVKPYTYPVRTVDHIDWNRHGQVLIHWVEPVGHHNTVPADKELTVR